MRGRGVPGAWWSSEPDGRADGSWSSGASSDGTWSSGASSSGAWSAVRCRLTCQATAITRPAAIRARPHCRPVALRYHPPRSSAPMRRPIIGRGGRAARSSRSSRSSRGMPSMRSATTGTTPVTTSYRTHMPTAVTNEAPPRGEGVERGPGDEGRAQDHRPHGEHDNREIQDVSGPGPRRGSSASCRWRTARGRRCRRPRSRGKHPTGTLSRRGWCTAPNVPKRPAGTTA